MAEVEEMTPWERHAAGAGMKRFSYAAVSELQHRPHAGFLVTCGFRREKSATKEIMDLLREYIGGSFSEAVDGSKDVPESQAPESDGKTEAGSKDVAESQAPESDGSTDTAKNVFSLIKLSRSGIVFLSTCGSMDVVAILSRVLEDIKTGARRPPLWCHRLLPVQTTCLSEKDAIHSTVLKLLKQDAGGIVSRSRNNEMKYAVGFNNRAGDDTSNGVERMECIEAVARAMREIEEHASVDLSNPEIVVAVEVLPIVGLRDCPLCGVSILPRDVVNAKPKLSIKTLSNAAANPEETCSKKRKKDKWSMGGQCQRVIRIDD